jgi:hypothetical protein
LGSGVSGYILAMLLRYVYSVPADHVVVGGRNPEKLTRFAGFTHLRVETADIVDRSKRKQLINTIRNAGDPKVPYGAVFECAGGDAVQEHIEIALDVLCDHGILALFGLTERNVNIDFATVMKKQLFIKGVFRSCQKAYEQSMGFIQKHDEIRAALGELIDAKTEIDGQRSFHDIKDAAHLSKVFEHAAQKKNHLGRLIVRKLQQV